ncbi:MAG: MotA/TolQ/ExbB proton channel family protein [Oscillospiraceae bacterium]|nr:MotA/TolQ/ExbB proton channel family protein [Oscillospiraceae bacterium]
MSFSLADILQVIADALLVPDMIVLVAFMLLTVWQVGDIIVELIVDRRKLKADVARMLSELHGRTWADISAQIDESRLLNRHKRVLHQIFDADGLSRSLRLALAERVLGTEEKHYASGTAVTDIIAKLGPMFGLLGTLIPLGPGIIALSNGDTATLADSLGVAFNTTIAGVASSSVCYVISHVRKGWYGDYMLTLETLTESIIEEVHGEAEVHA